MKNHNLELKILNPKKGEIPGPPIAQIYVNACSKDAITGTVYITPQCVSLSELEYECDRLIAEIENIRRTAKRKLR